MGIQIEIDEGILSSDKNIVAQETLEIEKETEQFLEEMQRLNSLWEGPAHQAYENQAVQTVEQMQRICQELGAYAECMDYAQKQYIKSEREVTDVIDRIRV